ncbi:hypothetical protein CPAST_c29130 [Clostridium pasteurianum DSM 525 = ATCC 6013]|uniref:Uncharacterized protein n=1 Tax=Clostridium pasteurianum DSM 525 = ATCC 6013 TaxID=1262449 RepID=A0A0H3J690_CLOPA|nr:hypothetical protein [Clostridium pasteurianum]AJA48979.1 hypothetical protein CPAST_c29130 [Clostridium pasteurianum DSM 525 = ATCC 6013]AJA52967.1 hypothetical protein CLPA_c29130 [Clostridium pasteurianum DSM 525 = ATCC 6013]AOZ76186.1 TetR family transcriptional regulator [Clostridium pasteurianum DSM 525 = ATCC 6013]AOZ79982.1 TetR family transcriptional regulator [Clostridium pasteurianum]ELP60275.1 hypothetical protein F502_06547 [Clostridium pasteurianum DSM 525 = ATCC 6013]
MASYVVITSINKNSKDFGNFMDVIENCSSFSWHFPHSSVWFIKSDFSTEDITDMIYDSFDTDDESFVIAELKNNKQGWLTDDQWNILNNNIFSDM